MKNICQSIYVVLFTLLMCASAQAREISVWAWDPNFNIPIITEAGKRYGEDHPNFSLKAVDYNKQELEQTLRDLLAAGNIGALPNIVLIEDYLAQTFLTKYPSRFIPLEDHMSYDGFANYKKGSMKVGEKHFGVPFDSGVTGLFMRTDLLSKIGISSTEVENLTWDEFILMGKRIRAESGTQLLSLPGGSADLLIIMLQSQGAWFTNEQGQIDLVNNQALINSLTMLKRIHDENLIDEVGSWNDWVGTFKNGVAAVISGSWIIGSIQSNSDHAGKWVLTAIPSFANDPDSNVSNLGGSSWYVIKKGRTDAEAIDFMKTVFTTDAGFYQKILRRYGAIGTYVPLLQGRAVSRGYVFFNNQSIYKTLTEWIPEIRRVNYGLHTTVIAGEVMAQFNRVLAGEDIPTVLRDVEANVRDTIN